VKIRKQGLCLRTSRWSSDLRTIAVSACQQRRAGGRGDAREHAGEPHDKTADDPEVPAVLREAATEIRALLV